jgi:hypothetical protein
MWLDWFSSRNASNVGNSLADHFIAVATATTHKRRTPPVSQQDQAIQSFLARIDSEARPLRLGMFRRAKLANSFKWRLLDRGLDPKLVDELTRMLLLRLA